MQTEQVIKRITTIVMNKLNEIENCKIQIGVSNRHVHVSKEDLEILFGKGYELTKKADLKQPGQFAANEVVTIRGPKGQFENVRILGPVREKSQVEISLTDTFRLGVKAPIKVSGDLDNTPGLEIIGQCGTVQIPYGTIVALRHIHMTPEQAKKIGITDKEIVDVEEIEDENLDYKNISTLKHYCSDLDGDLKDDQSDFTLVLNKKRSKKKNFQNKSIKLKIK